MNNLYELLVSHGSEENALNNCKMINKRINKLNVIDEYTESCSTVHILIEDIKNEINNRLLINKKQKRD